MAGTGLVRGKVKRTANVYALYCCTHSILTIASRWWMQSLSQFSCRTKIPVSIIPGNLSGLSTNYETNMNTRSNGFEQTSAWHLEVTKQKHLRMRTLVLLLFESRLRIDWIRRDFFLGGGVRMLYEILWNGRDG